MLSLFFLSTLKNNKFVIFLSFLWWLKAQKENETRDGVSEKIKLQFVKLLIDHFIMSAFVTQQTFLTHIVYFSNLGHKNQLVTTSRPHTHRFFLFHVRALTLFPFTFLWCTSKRHHKYDWPQKVYFLIILRILFFLGERGRQQFLSCLLTFIHVLVVIYGTIKFCSVNSNSIEWTEGMSVNLKKGFSSLYIFGSECSTKWAFSRWSRPNSF